LTLKKEKENLFLFSFYKFHRKALPNNLKELPGISIIKPLTGIDPNLYENLKTFFNMKYPRVCIKFDFY
jgi:ceramide glucosyltransferase